MNSVITDDLKLLNVRITHKKAPIHVLEKFTFKDIDKAYRVFLTRGDIRECVIVQTCNRVELFLALEKVDVEKIFEIWSNITELKELSFELAEVDHDKDAINHLLRLTCGLESLVVGEDQILGQVKRAFEYSRQNCYIDSFIPLIFEHAIKVGSRIRTNTGLNKGSTSIGSMAVNLAEGYFDDFQNKKVLLIGTGEGATLVAKSLKKRQVSFNVASRTFERAKSFSSTVGGTPIKFEDALTNFDKTDIIFVSTTAPYYLITYDRIFNCMKKNDGMMIFDLSNPRTVDDKIATISGIKLVNIDQIAEIVDRNLKRRFEEIRLAEKMIQSGMQSMDLLFRKIRAEPFVVSIFKIVDEVRNRELSKAARKLGIKKGMKEFEIMEQLSYAIVEGILSTPMNNFRKEIGSTEKNEDVLNIVSRIFNYEPK
ncbi:MAG: glutamyl-tRNA reductase [Thaumarchaeota archaeon]|nr:MAG: glutamyl-tRNA reductase [Nitrososphaerota archaeon]TLX91933.1 MAG: glutamyl-tRNA reductase [Nitrososphaerota archaeon]